jgi:PleD family two-component response regulator
MLKCDGVTMVLTTGVPPVLLIAVPHEHSLASVLGVNGYAAVEVHTGTLALEWARDARPDTIILDADLPDMSGIDVCRLLHGDLRIGHNVPILIVSPDKPTPEQRVTALRAGAWDYLCHPGDPVELALKLQTYVQAKRNLDVALAEGAVDPSSGVHSRPALARRARELGALMARKHGALACVVLTLDTDPVDPRAGFVVAQSARLSDVVGALGPGEFAVLAPATDPAGAVKLAQRTAAALQGANGEVGPIVPGSTLRIGYEAVPNLSYAPIDPVELVTRAAQAVRYGKPEPGYPWVRRFDATRKSGRTVASGLVLDERRTP